MLVYSVFTNNASLTTQLMKISEEINCNNLFSFYDKSCVKNYEFIKKISKNILVDSGAFSVFNSNPNIDFDKYFKQYYDFVKKMHKEQLINGFIELDIGSLVPYQQVLKYRTLLENISDKILPVWHLYLGVNEFKKMVKEYNYICIGGIVSKEINKNKLAPYVKYAHKNNCKIHALGLTTQKILKKVPFDSVDSLSWFRTRFGTQYYFNNGKVSYRKVPSNFLKKDYGKVDALSYLNHIKFQEYYHNYWKYYHND